MQINTNCKYASALERVTDLILKETLTSQEQTRFDALMEAITAYEKAFDLAVTEDISAVLAIKTHFESDSWVSVTDIMRRTSLPTFRVENCMKKMVSLKLAIPHPHNPWHHKFI